MGGPETSQPALEGDHVTSVCRSRLGVVGVISSVLGCFGWIGLVPFLDPCDQGERLARFFAALFNQILLAVVGGLATILLFVGLWLSRVVTRQGNAKLGRTGRVVSFVGLTIGVLVLLIHLPPTLMIAH